MKAPRPALFDRIPPRVERDPEPPTEADAERARLDALRGLTRVAFGVSVDVQLWLRARRVGLHIDRAVLFDGSNDPAFDNTLSRDRAYALSSIKSGKVMEFAHDLADVAARIAAREKKA